MLLSSRTNSVDVFPSGITVEYLPRSVSETLRFGLEDFCSFLSEFTASFKVEDMLYFSFFATYLKVTNIYGLVNKRRGVERLWGRCRKLLTGKKVKSQDYNMPRQPGSDIPAYCLLIRAMWNKCINLLYETGITLRHRLPLPTRLSPFGGYNYGSVRSPCFFNTFQAAYSIFSAFLISPSKVPGSAARKIEVK